MRVHCSMPMTEIVFFQSDSDQEQQQKCEHQRKQVMRLKRAKRLATHFQQAGSNQKSARPRPEPEDTSPRLKKHQT